MSLQKAGQFLDQARAGIKPKDAKGLDEDIEFLQAIHRILIGQTVIGRLNLEILRMGNPHSKRYRDALQWVEP